MKFFAVFFYVLLSYEWKTNTYFYGLKLENSENMVINPICDSQISCVFTGGKTRAKAAAKI